MKLRKITLLPLILLLLIACSKDDKQEELCNGEEYDRCCMQGEHYASPNESLTFNYKFRRSNAIIEWNIIDGDATVSNVETYNSGGETKSIATIQFNAGFTMARFSATAQVIDESCTYYFNVFTP